MTVRRLFATAVALLAVLLSGCGRTDSSLTLAEVDDPAYKQAKQLLRQGREQEALASFLRVIETRGSREAAESHLEAGVIFLHHVRNPVFAIYHFQKYLELRPTSPQAPHVRGLVATATREFAKTLPARPAESQSVRLELADEVERLRRENEELRAQLATLRGGAAPLTRAVPAAHGAVDLRQRVGASQAQVAAPPPAVVVQPTHAALDDSPTLQPAPLRDAPRVSSANPPTPAASRPNAPAPRNVAGGRVHTVAASDSLWKIGRQYYGTGVNAAKVRAIFEANRDVMRDETDLKVGMTLRIP